MIFLVGLPCASCAWNTNSRCLAVAAAAWDIDGESVFLCEAICGGGGNGSGGGLFEAPLLPVRLLFRFSKNGICTNIIYMSNEYFDLVLGTIALDRFHEITLQTNPSF